MRDPWPLLVGILLLLVLTGGVVAVSLIKKREGLSLEVYQDDAGKWTIGYGHLVVPGDPYYPYGTQTTITQEEAEALYQKDHAAASSAIDRLVKVPLSSNQRQELESFVFNVGETQFASSTLLRKLNAGDYQGAADEFPKWNHVRDQAGNLVVDDGLTQRRLAERDGFLAA